MHRKHGTQFTTLRIDDYLIRVHQLPVARQLLEFLEKRLDSFPGKETLEPQETVPLVARQGKFIERSIPSLLVPRVNDRVQAGEHAVCTSLASWVRVWSVAHYTTS